MRMRSQVIVVLAVFVATLAFVANVFAYTHAAEQRAENNRMAAAAPWAEPLRATTTTTGTPIPASSESNERSGGPSTDPSDEPSVEASDGPSTDPSDESANYGTEGDESRKEKCDKDKDSSDEPRNHGCEVSSFASDKDYKDGIDGPPGAVISEIARPDGQDTPPGQDKDKDDKKDKKDKDDD